MKTQTFEIIVPFSGFYESIHSSLLDDAIEQITSDSTGCHSISDKLAEHLYMSGYNYQAACAEYAKEYTEALAYEYNLHSLKFVRLISPKYYNYETDRILATINRDDLAKLAKLRNSKDFKQLCKDSFTSRSGFISFYESDPKQWSNKITEWDHNQLSTLLSTYIIQEYDGYDSSNWEYSLIDSRYLYEKANNAIYNNLTEQGARISNIAHYLRERESRA